MNRGYLLAVASYMSGAVGSIVTKALMEASSAETAAVLWYLSGSVMTLILVLAFRGGLRLYSFRRNARLYLTISSVMTVAALSWFMGIRFAGPSVVAFMAQLGIVFGVLLGAFVLREHIGILDGIGGAVAIAGAAVMTYRAGGTVLLGIVLALLMSIGLAIQSLLVKRNVAAIDKLELIFVRSVTAFVGILLYSIVVDGLVWPRTWVLPVAFVGSWFGYVMVNFLLYQALNYADLAKVSVLSVIEPPTVMVGAFLAFGDLPTAMQLGGGVLILIGVFLILYQPLMGYSRGVRAARKGSETGQGRRRGAPEREPTQTCLQSDDRCQDSDKQEPGYGGREAPADLWRPPVEVCDEGQGEKKLP